MGYCNGYNRGASKNRCHRVRSWVLTSLRFIVQSHARALFSLIPEGRKALPFQAVRQHANGRARAERREKRSARSLEV